MNAWYGDFKNKVNRKMETDAMPIYKYMLMIRMINSHLNHSYYLYHSYSFAYEHRKLNRNRSFDVRVRIVILYREIFKLKIKNVFHRRIYFHRWKRMEIARELKIHLLDMIRINMHITKRMNELS